MVFERIKLANPPDFTDQATEDVWFMLLEPLSDEAFMKAVNDLARTSPFFPNPPQILEAANTCNILLASEAWEMVQEDMNNCMGTDIPPGDMTPAIWKVIKTMGGLRHIWLDERGSSFVRMEFMKIYNQIVSSEKIITGGDLKELEEAK